MLFCIYLPTDNTYATILHELTRRYGMHYRIIASVFILLTSMYIAGKDTIRDNHLPVTAQTRSFLYGCGTGIMLQIASRVCVFAGVHRYRTLPIVSQLDPYDRYLDIQYENNNTYFYGSNCLTASLGASIAYATDRLFSRYATDFFTSVDPHTNIYYLHKGYAFSRNITACILGATMLLQQHPTRCFNHMGFYEVGSMIEPVAKATFLSYDGGHWRICGYPFT